MYKYLNGETDAVLKRAAAAAFDVKVEDVTPEFLAKKEREISEGRRRVDAQLKSEFKEWKRLKSSTLAPR